MQLPLANLQGDVTQFGVAAELHCAIKKLVSENQGITNCNIGLAGCLRKTFEKDWETVNVTPIKQVELAYSNNSCEQTKSSDAVAEEFVN